MMKNMAYSEQKIVCCLDNYWGMLSCGMWHHVVCQKFSGIMEKCAASLFTGLKSKPSKQRKFVSCLHVVCLAYSSTPKREVDCSTKMLVNLASHVKENTVHLHRYDDLISIIGSGYMVKKIKLFLCLIN
jgi:hypothetical protein